MDKWQEVKQNEKLDRIIELLEKIELYQRKKWQLQGLDADNPISIEIKPYPELTG